MRVVRKQSVVECTGYFVGGDFTNHRPCSFIELLDFNLTAFITCGIFQQIHGLLNIARPRHENKALTLVRWLDNNVGILAQILEVFPLLPS